MSEEKSTENKSTASTSKESRDIQKEEAVEPVLEDKMNEVEPIPSSPLTPPMQVQADVEKTPINQDPTQPGFISGGDIIIRLSQVELNERLNEVGEQTARANDISTQIAEAFNALGDEYERGLEINQEEYTANRDAIQQAQTTMAEVQNSLNELTKKISTHEDALDSMTGKVETQIDRQIQQIAGSVSTLDEMNSRQQGLLTKLVIVSIIMTLVSIGLHFMP